MSVAYFIVVDHDDPGFDTYVDGKMLTRHIDAVNAVAAETGQRPFEEYLSQDLSEFGMDESVSTWFDAAEGIAWVKELMSYIEANPGSVPDAANVVADLDDYRRVFEEALKRELKWHLELDF